MWRSSIRQDCFSTCRKCSRFFMSDRHPGDIISQPNGISDSIQRVSCYFPNPFKAYCDERYQRERLRPLRVTFKNAQLLSQGLQDRHFKRRGVSVSMLWCMSLICIDLADNFPERVKVFLHESLRALIGPIQADT